MWTTRIFKKESIGQSAGIMLFFTVLQRILQTGRGIVFARVLGPAEYGVYTLAFFFIPLAVTIARLGIPSCFSRYIPQYEKKGNLKQFLKRTYLLILSGGILATLICFFNAQRLSNIIFDSPLYRNIIMLSSLTIFPYVLYESLHESFAGLRVFKLASILHFSQFFIFTALGILLVIFYPEAKSPVAANLFSFLLVILIFSVIFQKYLGRLDSQNLHIEEDGFYGKIFKFSIFFVFAPIINTIFNYTDRWMIARFASLSAVGIYSIALNISGVIFLFGMIAGSVLLPNISHIWEEGDKNKVIYLVNFALKINTLFLLFGALVLYLFKRPIVSLLYGGEYMLSLPIVGMLLIFWLAHAVYWIIAGYAQLIEKTYIPLVCGAIGLISNVVLNYIFIPKYELMGAAVATTISFGLILVAMHLWFKKEGLKIKTSTVSICILPLIFVFNAFIAAFLFVIVLSLILGTNFIITQDEKETLRRQLKKGLAKIKMGKSR